MEYTTPLTYKYNSLPKVISVGKETERNKTNIFDFNEILLYPASLGLFFRFEVSKKKEKKRVSTYMIVFKWKHISKNEWKY